MKTLTTKNSNIAILITAAGSSTRIGGNCKKEYLPYKNGTVLSNCANTFLKAFSSPFENHIFNITDFIVTCPVGGVEDCKKALASFNCDNLESRFQIVEGSDTRQKSVYNGIKAVKNHPDVILIHDGARPFVSEYTILQSAAAAFEFGASVPGCTPVDTQKEINEDGFIVRHLQRNLLTAVQTPQCFKYEQLLQAHKKAISDGKEYTDDTEIWGVYCGNVKVVPGDINNIKITFPKDLERLEK